MRTINIGQRSKKENANCLGFFWYIFLGGLNAAFGGSMKRSAIRDIGSNMWILKFHLWHRCCKDNTVQSATNEIVTKDRKTILQHKEKTDKSRDPLVNKKMAYFS